MSNILFNDVVMEILCLFINNKNNFFYGRKISKALQLNQKTVNNYLNGLEKESILIKQQSGKNIDYKMNMDNQLINEVLTLVETYKLYKLKQNFQISQIINDFVKITDKPIMIFGSYAKGYSDEYSDLDVLILDDKIDKQKIDMIKSRYTLEVNVMTLSKDEFLEGLKRKEEFMTEVLINHIVCKGFEFITFLWGEEYGKN